MSVADCRVCSSTNSQGNIKKRLIVCCDGTFSGVDKGTKDYSSNVARLSRVLSRVGVTKEGEKVPQIVYYQSGVGTGSLTRLDKARQGAFGGSLAENVCEAYNFLVNNWGPGDEIFIFGFSRGAYTARSLAGFICQVGLLTPLIMDHFYEVYSAYQTRGELAFAETKWANEDLIAGELGTIPPMEGVKTPSFGSRLEYLRKSAHMHIKIKVVGVWDTVGSLTVTNWHGQAGDDSYFHTTKLNPSIENAFHALALDETRGNFPPTLWYLDSSCLEADGATPKVNLKQVWFPGYHSDIGGHSDGSIDVNSVDEIAFAWMIDQLHGLLQISATALEKYILFRLGDTSKFDTKNKNIRDLAARWQRVTWSDGKLDDNNGWLSVWWIGSLAATAQATYQRVPGETVAYEVIDGKKVRIPSRNFREEIHPCVIHRQKNWKGKGNESYVPAPFTKEKHWRYVEPSDNERGHWQKDPVPETKGWFSSKPAQPEVVLHEYIIPKHEELTKNYPRSKEYTHWSGSLERYLAPKDFIEAQDSFASQDSFP